MTVFVMNKKTMHNVYMYAVYKLFIVFINLILYYALFNNNHIYSYSNIFMSSLNVSSYQIQLLQNLYSDLCLSLTTSKKYLII
jgi:hypothetical protein